jgi:hypothetical protein
LRQGVVDKPNQNNDRGRSRPQEDDPGWLCLTADDEVSRGEESGHQDDVALGCEVSEEVEKIDRTTLGALDELANDRDDNRDPGRQAQQTRKLLHRG